MMKTIFSILFLFLSGFSTLTKAQTWPEELLLVPEKSNFVKTSTHEDVMRFLNAIVPMSDNAHLISMGRSKEGKEIPVVILANPKIQTVEQAKASGKPVIYIQGNIHGGEVEGKEALMMLMRDILLGDKKYWLENQIILFAPIYNTDGNDKMEKGRRPSQEDSPLEAGIRENSQGLDLNRDGVKLEAFETEGLITNIIVPWDPQLFVDLHTTNGTWHAYSLTWAPSYHSAGDSTTYEYTNNVMLKEITSTVKENYGLLLNGYGDYSLRQGWPVKNFYTYNHHPRYLVNQFGFRNRMAILSEAFSHERFYQRIYSTYSFVTEILEYTHRHIDDIVRINREAEERTIANVVQHAGKVKKGVRFEMKPQTTFTDFRTYEYITVKKSDGSTELVRTGNIVSLDSVVYFAKFEPTVESTLPRGYVIPAEFASIARHLEKHGVKVTRLSGSRTLDGEVFNVSSYEKAQRKFEGHFMATAKGEFTKVKRKFRKGDYIVDMAQPLANFIFYMLEPQSDDGLVNWNFFDEYFDRNNVNNKPVAYPVFKYYTSSK